MATPIPTIEGTSNPDVLAGGVFGVSIQSFATVDAPTYAPGVLYYDTTVGNLMIGSANVSVGYVAVLTSA